jgi:single-strand DNA-binding protein
MNIVAISGRLTKDPELIFTPEGVAICSFCVAVPKEFHVQPGNPEADYVDCIQFKKGAENTANLGRKGSQLEVTGRIQKRKYVNKEGNNRWITEVVANKVTFTGGKPKEKEATDYYPPVPNDYKNFDLGDE